MIYTNFVELLSLMVHVKFQNHRPSDSGEEHFKGYSINTHGGHLGHVTWTIYIDFRFLFLRMLHMKFGFDWPAVLEEDTFEHCGQQLQRRRTTEHGQTISLPCKPNGSGELITALHICRCTTI